MCLLVFLWLIVLGYNTGYLAVCTTLGLGKLYRRQNFKQGLPDYLIILLIRMLLYYCFHIIPDQPSAIKPKVNTVPLVIRFTVKLRSNPIKKLQLSSGNKVNDSSIFGPPRKGCSFVT